MLVIAILLVRVLADIAPPRVLQTNLENIPTNIDGYIGIEDYFEKGVYEELNADKHVYRHYTNKSNKKIVNLYIGYYGTKKGGRTPHNPYGCLPAGGWSIISEGKITVGNVGYSYEPELNYIISRKDNLINYILHWYQSDKDKVLATGLQQNIHRMIMKIKNNRNDGAYVQLSILTNQNDLKEDSNHLIEFTKSILKLLPKYWPNEG